MTTIDDIRTRLVKGTPQEVRRDSLQLANEWATVRRRGQGTYTIRRLSTGHTIIDIYHGGNGFFYEVYTTATDEDDDTIIAEGDHDNLNVAKTQAIDAWNTWVNADTYCTLHPTADDVNTLLTHAAQDIQTLLSIIDAKKT